jgi:hypothetical protein
MRSSTQLKRRVRRRLLGPIAFGLAGVALVVPSAALADSAATEGSAPIVSEKFADGASYVPGSDDKVIVDVPTAVPGSDDKVIVDAPSAVPGFDDKVIVPAPAAALHPDSRALRPGPQVGAWGPSELAPRPDGSAQPATGGNSFSWRDAGLVSAFTLASILAATAAALMIRRRRGSVAL